MDTNSPDKEVFLKIRSYPLIPLRNVCIFPGMRLTFEPEGEEASAALRAALEDDQLVFVSALRDTSEEEPYTTKKLQPVGTVCRVLQMLRVPEDNSVQAMIEGVSRAGLKSIVQSEPYYSAIAEVIETPWDSRTAVKAEALIRQCYGLFEEYSQALGTDARDVFLGIIDSEDPGYIADQIIQNIYTRHAQKQQVLAELRPLRRIALVNRMLRRELDIIQMEVSITKTTAEQLGRAQKEMFLREQMKAIQMELGEEAGADDIDDYRSAVSALKAPAEVKEKLAKEISRLAKQPFGSAEAAVLRGYLDTCLEIPWEIETEEFLDIQRVRVALDKDHYGLEKIKTRILEYLAVRRLAPGEKGSILCLVGPPGTGKTSIAQSIAHAMNRKLCRISLGGIHDEAEIRGHRKTYVGAMPGRIMTGIQQAGSRNPVMVLDEIDKLGSDYRGDPSAALLEVLDPEQNSRYRDHFLELSFDLSDVFFITTANTTETIPPALRDRMEIMELSSYTDEEKICIAKKHLLPKQRKKHGLTGNQLRIGDAAMREVIALYTRESGVRVLERRIAALCRKTAAGIVSGEFKSLSIRVGDLERFLGPAKYKDSKTGGKAEIGLVHGLAWTSVGGEILDAEVGVVDGSGKLELTGNLGKVMQESAKAALTYIRGRADALGIDPKFYENKDIHIHFPEGAVPKDGPSAGVTITTGLVSALTGRPVRQDVAMTGEITLRGRVLPIGGLREKTMAALRAGIHTVIIPAENEPDLEEIDPAVRDALRFITVSRADTVLEAALAEVDHAEN